MKKVSILNHVIGPVMRGPSSSHTAGPWRIGRMARMLLGRPPEKAVFSFHPSSSLAVCYHDQGSDLAFTSGLLGRSLTEPDFPSALSLAPGLGLDISFECRTFPEADHPNSSLLTLWGGGRKLVIHSRSTGGGSFEIASVNGFPLLITGERYEFLLSVSGKEVPVLPEIRGTECELIRSRDEYLIHASSGKPLPEDLFAGLSGKAEEHIIFAAEPVMFPMPGKGLCSTASGMLSAAEKTGMSLGKAALAYEEELLGIDKAVLQREMSDRLEIMTASVKQGFSDDLPMKLLRPSAGKLWKSAEKGSLFVGGPHARAAIRSMAALHVCASGGVACAAPTGGAAGVIPGVLITLAEDLHVPEEKLLDALWAAGAIGLFHDSRSTFAAEVAGCQVEIGAAGAMAAAAVVEAAGGTPRQACDAAATVFQNVMGSVCDLIQGVVEIPCHSRNAALASQAFLCSDLVLSGYTSPIPLDETISAVDSVGRMLPEELRCTSRGGLALCPSARAMPRLDKTNSNQGGKQ